MRIYGRRSGRNRPGARFARSYMFYSRQSQKVRSNRNTISDTEILQNSNLYGQKSNNHEIRADKNSSTGAFGGGVMICVALVLLASAVSDNQGSIGFVVLGAVFFIFCAMIFICVFGSKEDNNSKEKSENNGLNLGLDNIYSGYLLRSRDAEIKKLIEDRKNTIEQEAMVQKEISSLRLKLFKTKEMKSLMAVLKTTKEKLDEKLENATYIVTWERTNRYRDFENAMLYLREVRTVERVGKYVTSDIRKLFVPYWSIKEKIDSVVINPAPICVELGDGWFCITSEAIYCFDKRTGEYIACLSPDGFRIVRMTEEWTEREPYTEWMHRKVDGGPDRRYKNNPLVTRYNLVQRSGSNLICISICNQKAYYRLEPKATEYLISHKSEFELS